MASATLAVRRPRPSSRKSTKQSKLQVVPLAPASPVVSEREKRIAETRKKRLAADRLRREKKALKRHVQRAEGEAVMRAIRIVSDRMKEQRAEFTGNHHELSHERIRIEMMQLGQAAARLSTRLLEAAGAPSRGYTEDKEDFFAALQDQDDFVKSLAKLRVEATAQRNNWILWHRIPEYGGY